MISDKKKKKVQKKLKSLRGFRVMCCRYNVHELSLEIFNFANFWAPSSWGEGGGGKGPGLRLKGLTF